MRKTGFVWGHKPLALWMYRHKKPDARPFPEPVVNNYYGRLRLWNAIPSRVGVLRAKADAWGYPHREPPPKGLRQSREFFPFFMEKYFPDVECRLVIDSVLNVDTNTPIFEFPPHVSKLEIINYLRNIHGIDNIIDIKTKNVSGRTFKNEIGKIKMLPDVKLAFVTLDAPVRIDFKLVKTTEEADADKQKDAEKSKGTA